MITYMASHGTEEERTANLATYAEMRLIGKCHSTCTKTVQISFSKCLKMYKSCTKEVKKML